METNQAAYEKVDLDSVANMDFTDREVELWYSIGKIHGGESWKYFLVSHPLTTASSVSLLHEIRRHRETGKYALFVQDPDGQPRCLVGQGASEHEGFIFELVVPRKLRNSDLPMTI